VINLKRGRRRLSQIAGNIGATAHNPPAMLNQTDDEALHNNPDAYWCWDSGRWTFHCSHLVEPLTSPNPQLNHGTYIELTWQKGIA